MAKYAVSHRSTASQALIVLSVFAVLIADVGGRHPICHHPFSCGALSNISYPFRLQGDSPHCGPYELVCSDTNASVRIGSGTYYVVSINYTGSYFWVIETNWDKQSSCPFPRWDNHADGLNSFDYYSTAYFVNCSHEMNYPCYKPIRCLSTTDSFIYVSTSYDKQSVRNLKPSCGYLAMTPLGGPSIIVPEDASYEDVVKFMRKGFAISFQRLIIKSYSIRVRECLAESNIVAHQSWKYGIKYYVLNFLMIDSFFWSCVIEGLRLKSTNAIASLLIIIMEITTSFAMWCLKNIHVLCRFVLTPLAIYSFLAHKYWKTRITIDAVEKFLQMQQMLGGPLRYAYTDIIATTGHFRDRLGQGGYGSVYKGVLLPGNVHVAIKMLSNSKCNGEEFISEVSTIGRIHHVNVVRLVGFCSEEMRRALVYEYMPNGSLDKYIFSSQRSFSWDMLNEIASGIARGINYLHQGCDMQILHFDIKPHNILLDHNFVPKVADFGLAKLFPRDNSFVPLSAMRGTVGYIAPEMVSRCFGAISSKSDVYSFGMLLLEMAGGRRNADPNVANSSQDYYPSWVYARLIEQRVGEISIVDMHDLEKKLCTVGLWCIQMKSQDRPTMSEVIEMLESDVNELEMPSRPFFCDGGEHIPTLDSCYLSSGLDEIEEDE